VIEKYASTCSWALMRPAPVKSSVLLDNQTRVQQPNRCDLLHKNGIHMFRSETTGYSARHGWRHRQSYENRFRVRWFGGGGRRRVRVRNNSGQGAAMTIAIARAIRAAKLTGTDILRVGGSTRWSSLRAQG
jgi:hypothetical protein